MPEIYELSATEIVKKIKSRELSATQVAQAFLQRIAKVNPHLNAIHPFSSERVLREAQQADEMLNTGKEVGKLHGLPITIKDTCHVNGFKCSKGFPGLYKAESTYDATVVARLKNEGAIILGVTNTPELLLSYETDNSIYGRTSNPYDLKRTPGGSSGGEAAIICSGGSPTGIGSDAGGSIRQPAHYSGICGHKPTQGLVPMTGNVPSDGAGIVTQILTMGPMSRYAEDLTLIMDIISGPDQKDPHCSPVEFQDPASVEIGKMRIAYFYNCASIKPSSETIETINTVICALEGSVASISEAYPEPINNIYKLHWETFMLGGDGGALLKELYASTNQTEPSNLAQEFINRAGNCQLSAKELRQRLIEVEEYRYNMMAFMQDYDLIISPAATTPARRHGETHSHIQDFSYLTAHNLTGWPATVVPCGRSNDGLPIGIQIAAKPWNDHLCLALATSLQKTFGVYPIPSIQVDNDGKTTL